MKKLLILLIVLPLTITAAPTPPSTELSWDYPMEPIAAGITGYRVYCSTTSGSYGVPFQIVNPLKMTATFAEMALPDGAWFCTITAYVTVDATTEYESWYSNEVNFTLLAGAIQNPNVPAAPINLIVQ